MHPARRRCSSLAYPWYARSLRLVSRAPRRTDGNAISVRVLRVGAGVASGVGCSFGGAAGRSQRQRACNCHPPGPAHRGTTYANSEGVDKTRSVDDVTLKLSLATTVYVYGVVGAGTLAITASLAELAVGSVQSQWVILAALTLLSGIFATRIPSFHATLSVAETLVFALLLLFGPAPAIATVAANGLIASARVRHWSVYRTLFNVAEPAMSVWCAATVFGWLSGVEPPLIGQEISISTILVPLLVLPATYFALHTVLTAIWMRLESGLSWSEILQEKQPAVLLNYCVSSVLLVVLVRNAGNASTLAISAGGIVLGLIGLSHTFSKTYITHVEDANRYLSTMNDLYLSTVETLASAIDAKDQVTSGHIRRVQQSALRLAPDLGVTDPAQLKALESASLLHDLGKLVVPEHILNKPGSLSRAEFEQMKRHASIGAEILSKVGFPYPVEPIVRHHHENWDGSGYPDGLSGDAIPLGARILSVVDCFDALTSDRPYRRGLSREEALDIVRSRRGTMYDPKVVDAFLKIYTELAVAQERVGADLEPEVPSHGIPPGPSTSRSLPRLADILNRSIDSLPQDAVLVVYRRDPSADTLRAYWVSKGQQPWLSRLSIPIGESVTGWVGANQRAATNADPLSDFQNVGDRGRAFQSCISTPIQADSQLVGVLTIYSSQPSAFTARSEAIAAALATDIARALTPSIGPSTAVGFDARGYAVAVT